MTRDPLDDFIHDAVPPVHISARRVEDVMDGVMGCLDARATPVPASLGPMSPMAMLSRFVMPVAFGAALGVVAVTLLPAAPSAWGVSTMVASAYNMPGNF